LLNYIEDKKRPAGNHKKITENRCWSGLFVEFAGK
jgi:hypothetical protein